MQSRSEFLTHGILLLDNDPFSTDECNICVSTLSNPAKLPCGHIFDHQCIKKWLTMRGRNSCPSCKSVLFQLPPDERRIHDEQARQMMAAQALRDSGLQQVGEAKFDTFRCGSFSVSGLQRATAHAMEYTLLHDRLVPSSGVGEEHYASEERSNNFGPVVVKIALLAPFFVAMGNLIPAFATARDRPYSHRQRVDWQTTLTFLWAFVKTQEGKRRDALTFPRKLREEVKRGLERCYYDANQIEFFFRPVDPNLPIGPLYEDLDLLLSYLTVSCWDLEQEELKKAARRRETKEKRKEAREEPKMTSRCGMM